MQWHPCRHFSRSDSDKEPGVANPGRAVQARARGREGGPNETGSVTKTFDRGNLSVAYVKPFDLLVEGNETENWPGGRDSKNGEICFSNLVMARDFWC
jgi:hypothetical protein